MAARPNALARAALLAPAVVLALWLPQAAEAQRIGTAAAVNPTTTSTPPGAAPRTLIIGNDVVFDERIVTSPEGQTQLLFVDQSTLTIGPGAEVVLDRFVYDPATSTGDMVLSVTKGVFRFVGGKISSSGGATIRMPTAVIGIRGSNVIGDTENNHLLNIQSTSLTVENQAGALRSYKPGRLIDLGGPGISPSDKGRIPTDLLTALNERLRGSAGGGAPEKPTDVAIDSGIGRVGDAATSDAIQAAFTIVPGDTGTASDLVTWAGSEATIGETVADGTIESLPPPTQYEPEEPYPYPPISGAFAGRIYLTESNDTSRGFVGPVPDTGPNAGSITTGSEKFFFAFPEIEESEGEGPSLFGGENIEVPPIEWTAIEDPYVDGFFDPQAEFGVLFGLLGDDSGRHFFMFFGRPIDNAGLLAQTPRPFGISAFALSEDPIFDLDIPFLRAAGGGAIDNAYASPLYTARRPLPTETGARSTGMQASLAIDGQGANQQSVLVVWTGAFLVDDGDNLYLGGGFRSSARLSATEGPVRAAGAGESVPSGTGERFFGEDGRIDYFVLGTDQTVDGVYEDRNAFEQPFAFGTEPGPPEYGTDYSFLHVASRATTPEGMGDERSTRTLHGYASGIGETRLATIEGEVFEAPYALTNLDGSPLSVEIRTDADYNQVEATFQVVAGYDIAARFEFGGIDTAGAVRSSFIDDDVFAARDSADVASVVNGQASAADEFGFEHRGMLVTHATVPTTNFLPDGVSFCECRYAKWGYWAYDFRFPDEGGPNAGRVDRVHLGNWVAGELPQLADIPVTGTATYQGHAIGNVYNEGALYVAAGNYTQSWNFGTGAGTAEISNFDGHTFGTATNGLTSTNGRDFQGAFATSGFDGGLSGSFVKGGGDATAEVIGQFQGRMTEADYMFSGIIAGSKGGQYAE